MSYLVLARVAPSEGTGHEINEENEPSHAVVGAGQTATTGTRDSSFASFISCAQLAENTRADVKPLLAAGRRAVLSPAAREDGAELTARGGALP
jgi:hypothetical protein